MSVSIGRYDEKTGDFKELLVSTMQTFKNVWQKAIDDRGLQFVRCDTILYKENMQEILREFEEIKDYVQKGDFPDYEKDYVIGRVDNILQNLESFWNEIPGIDTLDMG